MLFNSTEFGLFLIVVFFSYWFIFHHKLKIQNLFVLVVSYLFYGWWDWRFLFLIFSSSLIDFIVGLRIEKLKNQTIKKRYLWTSIVANIGTLMFFKYFNFFLDNIYDSLNFLGLNLNLSTLNIILPVGISFYTFQTLSYTIDVYRGKMKATKDPIAFFAFISFFPQLVAGPIERATNLLPQFFVKRKIDFNDASNGAKQILWGLFKKIVIADNCATYVNLIFNDYDVYSGSTLFIGAILFAFQIYGDFSGYSDIAIGTARLFGFNLNINFRTPYFSRDIAEFWRRWHISLSTWFRDYVYIPLGGSLISKRKSIINISIVFLVSGFWHGANWTFIAWGAINAIYFLPLHIRKSKKKKLSKSIKQNPTASLKELPKIIFTFFLTCVAWILFRSESITDAFSYIKKMFEKSFFSHPEIFPKMIFLFIIPFVIFEWIQRDKEHPLEFKIAIPRILRWIIYYILIIIIFKYGNNEQEFIYFQF